jgi:hypothetical protein
MAFNFVAGVNVRPAGLQQISAATLATAQPLTAPTIDRVNIAMIQAEGGALRYTDDGTTPTATVGMLINQGETIPYQGDLTKLQLIRKDAAASANINYYRAGEGGE